MFISKKVDFEQLEKLARKHFNEIVIDYKNTCRFVGIAHENGDYFYILKYNNHFQEKYLHLSAVGNLIYLKGNLHHKDYVFLDDMMSASGCEKESEILIKT
jgi:hypothetical protein